MRERERELPQGGSNVRERERETVAREGWVSPYVAQTRQH